MEAVLESITGLVLAALARQEPIDATALAFLLRRFRDTDSDDLRAALEPALALALESHAAAQTIDERASWLRLFSDAVSLSEDERLLDAAHLLLDSLKAEWCRTTDVETAARSVDAGLRACLALGAGSTAAAAVDELERIVAGSYRPGEGLAAKIDGRRGESGRLAAHVALSSAMLAAFQLCGRLPYSMLAEELMQVARRLHWNDPQGCFDVAADPPDTFALNWEAARVLCRLALLHDDAGYRAAAVIRADASYADDAARILRRQEPALRSLVGPAARYGLALSDWLALTSSSFPAASPDTSGADAPRAPR